MTVIILPFVAAVKQVVNVAFPATVS